MVNSDQYFLAFDTSAPQGVIGLFHSRGKGNIEIVEFVSQNVQATHSEKLLPAIHSILERNQKTISDLSAIVVGQGPGSFTGLRIGITTANALSFALKIPVLGFSSLELLEKSVSSAVRNGTRLVLARDAFKGELFIRYIESEKEVENQKIVERAIIPQDLATLLGESNYSKIPWILMGDFQRLYPEDYRALQESEVGVSLRQSLPMEQPTPEALTEIVDSLLSRGTKGGTQATGQSINWVLPHYLRASNAEVNRQKSLGTKG